MTYELAEKLTIANFPNNKDGSLKTFNVEWNLFVPTLSELIEACGDNLESIIQRGNGEYDNWEARSKTQRFNASTLEEAIANLWLNLKQPAQAGAGANMQGIQQ